MFEKTKDDHQGFNFVPLKRKALLMPHPVYQKMDIRSPCAITDCHIQPMNFRLLQFYFPRHSFLGLVCFYIKHLFTVYLFVQREIIAKVSGGCRTYRYNVDKQTCRLYNLPTIMTLIYKHYCCESLGQKAKIKPTTSTSEMDCSNTIQLVCLR